MLPQRSRASFVTALSGTGHENTSPTASKGHGSTLWKVCPLVPTGVMSDGCLQPWIKRTRRTYEIGRFSCSWRFTACAQVKSRSCVSSIWMGTRSFARCAEQEARYAIYPLLPSVSDAIIRYLQKMRHRPSVHRQVFLSLMLPFRPISTASLRHRRQRLKALGVRTAHHGPHSLRPPSPLAGRRRTVSQGDWRSFRSPQHISYAIYAKVDLRGLREVAAFDVGELL